MVHWCEIWLQRTAGNIALVDCMGDSVTISFRQNASKHRAEKNGNSVTRNCSLILKSQVFSYMIKLIIYTFSYIFLTFKSNGVVCQPWIRPCPCHEAEKYENSSPTAVIFSSDFFSHEKDSPVLIKLTQGCWWFSIKEENLRGEAKGKVLQCVSPRPWMSLAMTLSTSRIMVCIIKGIVRTSSWVEINCMGFRFYNVIQLSYRNTLLSLRKAPDTCCSPLTLVVMSELVHTQPHLSKASPASLCLHASGTLLRAG